MRLSMPGSPLSPEQEKPDYHIMQVLTIISECPSDVDVFTCEACEVYWVGASRCWNCQQDGTIVAKGAQLHHDD